MPTAKRQVLGHYIVADPKICHGKPTFIGTRIMVWQVLQQLANGKSWDEIIDTWDGDVSKQAIAEAIALAGRIFADQSSNFSQESQPA